MCDAGGLFAEYLQLAYPDGLLAVSDPSVAVDVLITLRETAIELAEHDNNAGVGLGTSEQGVEHGSTSLSPSRQDVNPPADDAVDRGLEEACDEASSVPNEFPGPCDDDTDEFSPSRAVSDKPDTSTVDVSGDPDRVVFDHSADVKHLAELVENQDKPLTQQEICEEAGWNKTYAYNICKRAAAEKAVREVRWYHKAQKRLFYLPVDADENEWRLRVPGGARWNAEDVVIEALRDAGKPLTMKELLEAVGMSQAGCMSLVRIAANRGDVLRYVMNDSGTLVYVAPDAFMPARKMWYAASGVKAILGADDVLEAEQEEDETGGTEGTSSESKAESDGAGEPCDQPRQSAKTDGGKPRNAGIQTAGRTSNKQKADIPDLKDVAVGKAKPLPDPVKKSSGPNNVSQWETDQVKSSQETDARLQVADGYPLRDALLDRLIGLRARGKYVESLNNLANGVGMAGKYDTVRLELESMVRAGEILRHAAENGWLYSITVQGVDTRKRETGVVG